MTKMKRFKLHDSAGRISRKRINKRRTVNIRRERNLKAAQFEEMN